MIRWGDVLLDIRRATLGVPRHPPHALEFHRRILERIVARDSEGACAAMAAHLEDIKHVWRALADDQATQATRAQ